MGGATSGRRSEHVEEVTSENGCVHSVQWTLCSRCMSITVLYNCPLADHTSNFICGYIDAGRILFVRQ